MAVSATDLETVRSGMTQIGARLCVRVYLGSDEGQRSPICFLLCLCESVGCLVRKGRCVDSYRSGNVGVVLEYSIRFDYICLCEALLLIECWSKSNFSGKYIHSFHA